MHVLSDLVQLDQIGIADDPAINGPLQVAEMTEIQVQPDQARNVVGVIAPFQNGPTGSFQVGRLAVQGNP
ncbi:hypothetical protein D3C85_1940490 [compost metagenome]